MAEKTGADLARLILAQAKRDARERAARSRRPGQPRPSKPGDGRDETDRDQADQDEADRDEAGRGGADGRARGSAGTGTGTDFGSAEPGSADGTGRGPAGGSPAGAPGARPARRRLPGIAPPGRDWRQPVAFGAAMRGLMNQRGWRDKARDTAVLTRWDSLVGPDVATHCTPVSLRDGVLVVAAESTAWATQLRLMSRQILRQLRDQLGPDAVRSMTVRGPSAPDWDHGPLRAPGGRGPRDTYG
jgi:predicted nucleic acid-binding Zn ribbon protein